MSVSAQYKPSKAILGLGGGFYDAVEAARFPTLILRFRNQAQARRLGLGELSEEEWEAHFGRFVPLPGGLERPLALRYHGYQFRQYNPDLGDGRGFLFAQLEDPVDGRLLDLGTKGSGTTPWSRGGDGRLTLKGGVREVLATEMLEALGVYTSRSFSLFETGEQLVRGDEPSPTRSSVLVRLSHGHIRFGSFERHAFNGDKARITGLLDYCIERFFPSLERVVAEDRPIEFLREVCHRSAELAASWMVAGFVHGVLNTDNMNVTGESFDYGPYRFLPRYDEDFVAAYFDYQGLYKYGDQHLAVIWNLSRLAEALSHIAPQGTLGDTLFDFLPTYMAALVRRFVRRLGLISQGAERDSELVRAAQDFLTSSPVGYDRFFFDWYGGAISQTRALKGSSAALYEGPLFSAFRQKLRRYEPLAPQRLELAYFQREAPCALLIDEIERIWAAIDERDDWAPFVAKIHDIRQMKEACGLAALGA